MIRHSIEYASNHEVWEGNKSQAGSLKSIIIGSIDYKRGFPLTQYITNGGISRARYTITHFKHYHRVLRLISCRMSV